MNETIKIGRMYKSSYDSIVKIVTSCGFTTVNNVPISIVDGKICYGENVYEYSNNTMSYESDNIKFEMTKNGANWFNNFRNTDQLYSFDSGWKDLIQNIAYKFHSEYSFLEFDAEDYELTKAEEKSKKDKAESITKKFFKLKNSEIKINSDNDQNKSIIDYYGAILKLEVSDDTRESEVILCKVYFKKEADGKFTPILSSDAKEINDIFLMKANDSEIVGIKRVEGISEIEKDRIMQNAVEYLTDALIDLINDDKKNFADYYFLHHEGNNSELSIDEKVIKKIIDNAPSLSTVNISCKNMSLLSIIHAKWNTVSFGAYINNRKYLDFEFGLKDKVTVRCSLCRDKTPLIIDDMLLYYDKNQELAKISIDDDNVLDYIDNSRISEHIITMDRCSSNNRKIECKNNIVCKKDLFETDGKFKCLNCHFPEIVYIGNDNIPRLNRNLLFASDTNDLHTKDKVIECRICGRKFANITSSICPQCSSLLDKEPSIDEKKTYKRYSHFLPLRKRIIKYKGKCGYEDDELIVLKISKAKLAIIDKFEDYKDINIIYSSVKGK